MLIDEEVYLDLEVQDFLEHHGVKGQKWGVRTAKAAWTGAKAVGRGTEIVGKGSWAVTKAVGRGTRKTASFVRQNPQASASIAVGAAFAVGIATHKIKIKQTKESAAIGKAWLSNRNNFSKATLFKGGNIYNKKRLILPAKTYFGKGKIIAVK